MRRILPCLLLFSSLLACAQDQATRPVKVDVSGAWILREQMFDEVQTHRMSLQVSRLTNRITGQIGSSKIDGTISDSHVSLRMLTSSGRVIATYTGEATDGGLKGTGDWDGTKSQWSARRPASKPEGPQTHTYTPTEFYRTFSYNQIKEGATIYLPVFHDGALLMMGDGHAAQGDGELTGDALETSMDIEFTVDVIPQKSIGTPRVENDEFLMAVGIAGSLDQAVQSATSEMARWLERDYKLNPNESAMILGSAMKYDVADLVSTQVSIVAKVPKSLLATLRHQ